MDPVVIGVDILYGMGGYIEVATLYWRHVMLVPLRVQGSLFPLTGLASLVPLGLSSFRTGSLVGLGGFHGRRQQFSHWFLMGAELIVGLSSNAFNIFGETVDRTLVGWLLPVGYDFRHHFGRELRRSWGLRVYVAWMPLYRGWYDGARCSRDKWYCDPDRPGRKLPPLTAGLCLFYGFK